MKRILPIILLLMLPPALCRAEEQTVPDQRYKESYSLGYEFGANLKLRDLDLDNELLLKAIREGLEGKAPALDPVEIKETLKLLQKKVYVLSEKRIREAAAKNLEEGKAYMAGNKGKEGVKTLPSGLQYRVLREGTGPVPREGDAVTVHYRGTLVNGIEFDSSHSREEPATVPIESVIPGWLEALKMMKTGSKWEVVVPPELAYGERQFGRIPANSTLIFEIELLATARDMEMENPGPSGEELPLDFSPPAESDKGVTGAP